ncbi:hypothetical protein VP01_898g2, partial [Puccinia sorghi]
MINLISPGCLDKKDCAVLAKNGCFKVLKSSQLVLQGSVRDGLYSVDKPESIGNPESIHYSTFPSSLQEIHESFGHALIRPLDSFIPKAISQDEKSTFEYLIGPIDPQSREQHQFILTVVDNYLGYLAGFPL